MSDLTKISLFKDCKEVVPIANILVFDFYNAIQTGDYKDEINEIRANPEKAKDIKMKLPAVTISGTFLERNKDGLLEHSGRIGIDIDGKDNPHIQDWESLRNTLSTWKEIEFVSLSASGKGLFIVVPISNPKYHYLYYRSIEKTFKKYGITIDTACKDIPRLRFITYDKCAIINEYAKPYRLLFHDSEQKVPVKQIEDDPAWLINEIISKKIDLTSSYHSWYQIGAAIASEYGENGRQWFHLLSSYYPKYVKEECDRQYDKCLSNPKGYTIATLYYYAKQYGLMIKDRKDIVEKGVLHNTKQEVCTKNYPHDN